jgi:hypothetical protein
MGLWTILQKILLGIVKLVGAVAVLGFSLGVTANRKLKEDSGIILKTKKSPPPDMADDMTEAIENAAEQVIGVLEKRTAIAAKLLDEAEEKIALLKDILEAHEKNEVKDNEREEPEATEEMSVEHLTDTGTSETKPEGKRALIFKLADEGLNVQEIAKNVGIGHGEAELILQLRDSGD